MFDAAEEPLDEIAMLVLMPIEVALYRAMSHGRDHGLGPSLGNRRDQRIGIEGFVGDHGIGLDAVDQGVGSRQIVRLPAREFPPREIPQPFD